jgi:ribA/ribD-fused uncharacterized protein
MMKAKPITNFSGEFSFLSNFYAWPVEFEGAVYDSVECAFQAAKTTDLALRRNFEHMKPAEAKRAGRKLPLRLTWDMIRLDIMEQLLRRKFEVEPMRGKLLSTGEAELIETNWWRDRFWGVYNGAGENHLGKLLMKVREELRKVVDQIPVLQ